MSKISEFQCAPGLRLEGLERVQGLQVDSIAARLDRLETVIERLERRLWLTVYGVVGVILAQGVTSIIDAAPK